MNMNERSAGYSQGFKDGFRAGVDQERECQKLRSGTEIEKSVSTNAYFSVLVPAKVTEETEHILAALPGKVFYAEDGEALILADEGRYIISVTPNNTEFNNGNPVTSSAYLVNAPAEQLANGYSYSEAESVKGWTSGWDC